MTDRYRRFVQDRDRREHEQIRSILAAVLRPDDDCVDVGASVGDILVEMVRLAPRGRHVAYEPIPTAHAALAARFPTVQVRGSAATDSAGRATFFHVADEPALSSLRSLPYHAGHRVERIEVDTETLDGSLPPDRVPRVIKIDAEGAELQILAGARSTIRRHRPILLLEFIRDGSDQFAATPQRLLDLLADLGGFRLYDVFGAGPYGPDDLNRVVHARRVQNFVAYPCPGTSVP